MLLRLCGRPQRLARRREEAPEAVRLVEGHLGLEVARLRQRHVGYGEVLSRAGSVQAADASLGVVVLCLSLAHARRCRKGRRRRGQSLDEWRRQRCSCAS